MKLINLAVGAAAIAMLPTPVFAQGSPIIIGKIIAKAFDAEMKTALNPTFHHWQVGSAPILLPYEKTHVCMLTNVSGNFAGAAERIALYIDKGAPGGPRWTLNGTSAQAELKGSATCVAKARFVPVTPNGVRLGAYQHTNHMTGACAPHIVGMPFSNKTNAYFISGIAGKFRGGGERVGVTGKAGNGAIHVAGCSGFVDGTLVSFGMSSGVPAKYRTLFARKPLGAGVTFAASDSGPQSTSILKSLGQMLTFQSGDEFVYSPVTPGLTHMVAVDEAICGIVAISGKMQGYGESVAIEPLDNNGKKWWVLRVRQHGTDAKLSAAARCYARDQR